MRELKRVLKYAAAYRVLIFFSISFAVVSAKENIFSITSIWLHNNWLTFAKLHTNSFLLKQEKADNTCFSLSNRELRLSLQLKAKISGL